MATARPTTGTVLIRLAFCGLLGLAPTLAAQGAAQQKLLPNDGLAGDEFGSSVATDGALVAVGSPTADQSGSDSGSAYVYQAATGAQLLELVPTNGAPGDRLGASIAVDGARVAVGAPLADRAAADSGTVYLFDANTGAPLLELAPSGASAGGQFGFAVAMDGGLVAVGSLGAAHVFDASTGQQLHELKPTGGSSTFGLGGFGEAVDIDAGRVVVGARTENGVSGFSGAAYVFDAATGVQLHRLIANNGTAWSFFGAGVAIDGDVVAIGAPEAYGGVGKHAGVAYVFDASTGQQVHDLWPSPSMGGHVFAKFGSSVAVDGQDVFIGSENNHADASAGFVASAGSVYLYDAQSGGQVEKLVADDAASSDEFGGAVAAADGILAVGAARNDDLGDASGSAYVFDRDPVWSSLGHALAGTHGDPVLVGFGSLAAFDPVALSLSNALENSVAYLVVGLSTLDAPFQGGTLVPDPNPPGIVFALPTGPTGQFTLGATWPGGVPSGLTMFFQSWIVDPVGPAGYGASNAVSATTP